MSVLEVNISHEHSKIQVYRAYVLLYPALVFHVVMRVIIKC
jgi:hypothetical protein